jgi:hypothetical protein
MLFYIKLSPACEDEPMYARALGILPVKVRRIPEYKDEKNPDQGRYCRGHLRRDR